MGENGVVVKGQPNSGVFKQGNVFLEFVDLEDVKWVLEAGNKIFRGNPLQLKWWDPKAGCPKRKDTSKEV